MLLPAVEHLQGLAVVAPALARLAAHVDVGQEVHLHAAHAVALAGLAAAALHVEGEAARLVAARPRLRGEAEQLADEGEGPGVGRRVAARRAADGALVDGNDAVDGLRAFERPVRAGLGPAPLELLQQRAVQDVVDQRRLARARDAGDRGEHAERDLHVEIPEVVGPGAQDAQRPPRRPAHGGHLDPQLPAQVAAGEAAVDVLGRALVHHPAAQPSRALAEVHHVVRGLDRLLVVLDHHHRIAEVADLLQRLEQAEVVALVQSHRGLVEDVEHALHARPDLGGQADAVGLAAGQGRGGTVEGQVAHARPPRGSAGATRSRR